MFFFVVRAVVVTNVLKQLVPSVPTGQLQRGFSTQGTKLLRETLKIVACFGLPKKSHKVVAPETSL